MQRKTSNAPVAACIAVNHGIIDSSQYEINDTNKKVEKHSAVEAAECLQSESKLPLLTFSQVVKNGKKVTKADKDKRVEAVDSSRHKDGVGEFNFGVVEKITGNRIKHRNKFEHGQRLAGDVCPEEKDLALVTVAVEQKADQLSSDKLPTHLQTPLVTYADMAKKGIKDKKVGVSSEIVDEASPVVDDGVEAEKVITNKHEEVQNTGFLNHKLDCLDSFETVRSTDSESTDLSVAAIKKHRSEDVSLSTDTKVMKADSGEEPQLVCPTPETLDSVSKTRKIKNDAKTDEVKHSGKHDRKMAKLMDASASISGAEKTWRESKGKAHKKKVGRNDLQGRDQGAGENTSKKRRGKKNKIKTNCDEINDCEADNLVVDVPSVNALNDLKNLIVSLQAKHDEHTYGEKVAFCALHVVKEYPEFSDEGIKGEFVALLSSFMQEIAEQPDALHRVNAIWALMTKGSGKYFLSAVANNVLQAVEKKDIDSEQSEKVESGYLLGKSVYTRCSSSSLAKFRPMPKPVYDFVTPLFKGERFYTFGQSLSFFRSIFGDKLCDEFPLSKSKEESCFLWKDIDLFRLRLQQLALWSIINTGVDSEMPVILAVSHYRDLFYQIIVGGKGFTLKPVRRIELEVELKRYNKF